MAALAAAATVPIPDIPYIQLESAGVILVYGRDERAIEAACLLKDHLDVTVLITRPENLTPPRVADFPIVKGTIRAAKGYIGAFQIAVDDYASLVPSSRGALQFGIGRNGATSHCDILLDLSGGAPLFSAADLRDGYVRADPGDPAAVLKGVLRARDLVGSFDKPQYIAFDESLCAHSRSGITGCHRCLDLCPTGAIAPSGDHVVIDAHICAGCGQCAAVCPTGAAGYALPPADVLMRKLRAMLSAYREAGGDRPVLLFHDDDHGGALIDALARHGDGLPANVLPFGLNEVTQTGLKKLRLRSPTVLSLYDFYCAENPVTTSRVSSKPSRSPNLSSAASVSPANALQPSRRTTRLLWTLHCAASKRVRLPHGPQVSSRSGASATSCGSHYANCTALRQRPSISSHCLPARHLAP